MSELYFQIREDVYDDHCCAQLRSCSNHPEIDAQVMFEEAAKEASTPEELVVRLLGMTYPSDFKEHKAGDKVFLLASKGMCLDKTTILAGWRSDEGESKAEIDKVEPLSFFRQQ